MEPQEQPFREDFNFGPSSSVVRIPDFVRQAETHKSAGRDPWVPVVSGVYGWDAFQQLRAEERQAIVDDCSVDDVCSTISEMAQNQNLYEFLRQHRHAATEVAGQEFNPHRKKDRRQGLRSKETHAPARRRKASTATPAQLVPQQDDEEIMKFQEMVFNIKLQSWPLPPEAGHYIRLPRAFDANVLTAMKHALSENPDPGQVVPPNSTLITISVYASHAGTFSRRGHMSVATSFYSGFQRISQHTLLASQTLGDLCDVMTCPANEIPLEMQRSGTVIGYDNDKMMDAGRLVVVEDIVYSDGTSQNDYGRKLLSYTEELNKQTTDRLPIDRSFVAGSPLHDTQLASVNLRLNSPYWMLHQGNCEHILLVDQIRLLHPNDPRYLKSYPLTTQSTPKTRRLCRVCARVPATLSVVNDLRLGESPCLLCDPCWEMFGHPKPGRDETEILVVPIFGGESGSWQ